MIRRSFNTRFRQPIFDEIKITTIRDNPWPVGVPIMAFNWSGLPYRSKQENIAPIVVLGFWPIEIAHVKESVLSYGHGMENAKPLWQTEGFNSREELDEWFRPLVKPGHTVTKFLHRFRLMERGEG